MRRIYSKTGKSVLLLLFLEENSCLLCLSVQTPGDFFFGGGAYNRRKRMEESSLIFPSKVE